MHALGAHDSLPGPLASPVWRSVLPQQNHQGQERKGVSGRSCCHPLSYQCLQLMLFCVHISATLNKGEADFLQQAIRVLDSKDLNEEGIYR